MSPRALPSRRNPTVARLHGWGRCLASLLLSLLAVVPATAAPASRWSLGLSGTQLSAGNDFASTGTAERSTPETRASASADFDAMEHFGLEVGFRASRLFGLKLGWMPGGDLPMAFQRLCDPCQLVNIDPGTGEDHVFLIATYDDGFETNLGIDLTTLDVSLFLPLSRRSSSAGRRFELFFGPTLAQLDSSLQQSEELRGVDLDVEIENDLGAHLGLELRATPSWTIHATGRWFRSEMALDYNTSFQGTAPDPRPLSALAIHAPPGSSKADWILISLGTSWRF
jgi:hypothetical protein